VPKPFPAEFRADVIAVARKGEARLPLVLDIADDGVPVVETCRVLGFSTQAFYKWRKAPVSQRDWDDAHLIDTARDIHADDPAFGYRFIADELSGRGMPSKTCTPTDSWATRSTRE
jgi:hypothetical protein